jgi:hypothetical protein
MGAKTRAEAARQEARKAARAADRAEAEAWSVRMEGYGGPVQPSPTIGQCLNGGYGWLEIECCRCKMRASLPLDAIRRARDMPIWKLEPSVRCRSCGTRRYKPPVRMIKLTEQREIPPYKWVPSALRSAQYSEQSCEKLKGRLGEHIAASILHRRTSQRRFEFPGAVKVRLL